MNKLTCGTIIKHKTLGVGLVILQKPAKSMYGCAYDYFTIAFTDGNAYDFTNDSISDYLVPLSEGDLQMIKTSMSIEQREYFVNILKNGIDAKNAFYEVDVTADDANQAISDLHKLGLTADVLEDADIYLQILLNGETIALCCNHDKAMCSINLTQFLSAVNSFLSDNPKHIDSLDKLEEIGSLLDNDHILQLAAFNEVLYNGEE